MQCLPAFTCMPPAATASCAIGVHFLGRAKCHIFLIQGGDRTPFSLGYRTCCLPACLPNKFWGACLRLPCLSCGYRLCFSVGLPATLNRLSLLRKEHLHFDYLHRCHTVSAWARLGTCRHHSVLFCVPAGTRCRLLHLGRFLVQQGLLDLHR